MADQSPPKRVTRARAAAKTDNGVKIATAASKAKVTRTASLRKAKAETQDDEPPSEEPAEVEVPKTTRGRAKKNLDTHDPNETKDGAMELSKTTRGRAKKTVDEEQHEVEIIEPESKSTRGRGKKATVAQPDELEMQEDQAPVRSTRGRPKKAVETPALETVRSTRGRAKKAEPEEKAVVVMGESQKPLRARAATVSKITAPKKTVKFEEPDKENIAPLPANEKGKARVTEVSTGLKAKPVRKPATAATRATRGRAKVEETEQKLSPLSPKKATQVTAAKDSGSDDELAIDEKTPMKPLMKSPIRAPGSVLATAKRLDFSNSVTANRAVGQDLSGSIMASPARRPQQSPFKETVQISPRRANFAGSFMKSPFKLPLPPKATDSTSSTNLKASLLQSPARRPQSPTKVNEQGSPSRSRDVNPMISGVTPKPSTFKISRFATPRTLTKIAARPGQMLPPSAFKNTAGDDLLSNEGPSDELFGSNLSFSGRLSSIIPREVDPAVSSSDTYSKDTEAQSTMEVKVPEEAMLVDEKEQISENPAKDHTTTPPCSPPRNSTGSFARDFDESPFVDSDSEDELASGSLKYSPALFASSPSTPTQFVALSKTPKTQKSSSKDRRSQIGFTPLARQLSNWMAASPDKSDRGDSDEEAAGPESTPKPTHMAEIAGQPSPTKSTFFDDEMSIREDFQPSSESADLIDDENFTPIEVVEEDLALADEADEMSLLEIDEIEERGEIEKAMEMLINTDELTQTNKEQMFEEQTEMLDTCIDTTPIDYRVDAGESSPFRISALQNSEQTPAAVFEDLVHSTIEPALSEVSQEYGDENAIPIDPVLLALSAPAPATPTFKTPKRVLAERVCHTVSKVPLKAAAEDSPMRSSPVKRSASISRIPASRPSSNLVRSNTVISYSPVKSSRQKNPQSEEMEDETMEEASVTPSKPETDAWSNIGTPARTPRRDLNIALLKGAVVFVDVHTSEGADASSLFIELLNQMGARCVKSWSWNPNSGDGSKIGITHVVFKDGGKRTLEKAKQTGGVVTCVGVGWVLDCERENKWLPESSYSVDTTAVPRGGHRRRKSMEPRALANLNGTLLPSDSTTPARRSMSPRKNPNSFAETPMTSKSRRRDSVQWVLSPSSTSSGNDDDTLILSPVPATPAPEFISAYGEEGLYGNETPSAQTPYFLQNEQLIQQTAPVAKFGNFEQGAGSGFLSEKKDESVMMRLMAARRKSLQWAPKVGSPLARGTPL